LCDKCVDICRESESTKGIGKFERFDSRMVHSSLVVVFVCFVFRSIEESKNLSSRLLASGLFMCHNSVGGRKDNVTELPGWQQVDDPFLNFGILYIETRTNDTALVEAASQLDDNLVRTVIIDNFEFTDIA